MKYALMRPSSLSKILIVAGFILTSLVYWPGLTGGWIFDDNPNILDNPAVQPHNITFASLANAAFSSPSSDFKRPLASLSFAVNYLFTGLNPFWMKLTNLIIHLLNGLLTYLLARLLLQQTNPSHSRARVITISALIATGWMLLPINLTAVLYIVQRMESMANLFVLLGLIGYITGRRRMLQQPSDDAIATKPNGLLLCVLSILFPTALGSLAKETAVLLPLYAFLVELIIFGFRPATSTISSVEPNKYDHRLIIIFVVLLALPFVIGTLWLLPWLRNPETWANRGFTLSTRLLSEARIVADYIVWTVAPTPSELSFYHDNFRVSENFFSPWTTFGCAVFLIALLLFAFWIRKKYPLVTLGIAFFLGCHLLTATVLPLELIYEHRNYFASFGLMLVLVPLLVPSIGRGAETQHLFPLARIVLLVAFFSCWGAETLLSALAWGDQLELPRSLARSAPDSPRAQYELGRTYIVYSNYNPNSPFTQMAYPPLEKAAAIPGSSILPEQALIFMNSRMHLPIKDAWWDSLIDKLKSRKPSVQDESSIGALTDCAIAKDSQRCDFPIVRLEQAYFAALSHKDPSARLLAMYADFAWNGMNDPDLGLRMAESTVSASPSEPAYRITLIRMLVALRKYEQAKSQMLALEQLNYGGRLNASLAELRALPGMGSTDQRAKAGT